jgi:phage terminase large subunit-like protein
MLNSINSFLRPAEQKASRTAHLIAIESGARAVDAALIWAVAALTFAARGQPRVRRL